MPECTIWQAATTGGMPANCTVQPALPYGTLPRFNNSAIPETAHFHLDLASHHTEQELYVCLRPMRVGTLTDVPSEPGPVACWDIGMRSYSTLATHKATKAYSTLATHKGTKAYSTLATHKGTKAGGRGGAYLQ